MVDPYQYREALGNFRLVISQHPKSEEFWLGWIERFHEDGEWLQVWESHISDMEFDILIAQLRQSRREYFWQDCDERKG